MDALTEKGRTRLLEKSKSLLSSSTRVLNQLQLYSNDTPPATPNNMNGTPRANGHDSSHRVPQSASEPNLSTDSSPLNSPHRSLTTYATKETPFHLDQVRSKLHHAIEMVAKDFAVNGPGGQVQRVSGDSYAQGVKNFINAKHNAGPKDFKTAVFCSGAVNSSLPVRLNQGNIPSSDIPFSLLTVHDQTLALRKKVTDIEDAERRERAVKPQLLTRTVSVSNLATNGHESSNGKKDKKEKKNGYATIRGSSSSATLRTMAEVQAAVPILNRKYNTAISERTTTLKDLVTRLRGVYSKKTLVESDTVNSIIDNLENTIRELDRTDKIRAECEREAHSMFSFSLEMLKGLPLVYLAREVAVGTCLCIGSNSGSDKVPVCGKIDIILYDLYEHCYVLADLKTTRPAIAEGEDDYSGLPMEYKFLKRVNILQLQMYAALLEHVSGGQITVGYVLIMGFDASRNYEYTTWRINFDPKFYLTNDFSHRDQIDCFYYDAPRALKPGELPATSTYRAIAPYNTSLVARKGATSMRAPLLTRDAAEALMPHRFVASPHRM